MPHRQEVPNVVLAELLQERGLVAAPEEILRGPAKKRRLPDVVIDFQGLRLAIEAEYGFANRKKAWEKARERVQEGVAHVGVAVAYPTKLRSVKFERLRSELEDCKLEYAVLTEASEPEIQLLLFKEELFRDADLSFGRGTVDDLGNAIRRAYEQLVRDETLERVVQLLDTIMGGLMAALENQPATTDRLAAVLGVQPLPAGNTRGRCAVNRITALILANAMIFQEVLCKGDRRVRPLQGFRGDPATISSLADHWGFILADINYYPIFKTAHDLIKCISADRAVTRTFGNLLDTALDIVRCRASLRHDLAGRIYHRLLEEAKYLGAFYTSIPAATLLLKLAIPSNSEGYHGSQSVAIPDMRIADLACGTGTLLMAASDALMDRYVRMCAQAGTRPRLQEFHTALVEKMIYGFDVLPSAIHLTASTLALRVPETPVNVTHLYSMPLGGNERHLGSLDLLERNLATGTLFGDTVQMTGKRARGGIAVSIPMLDLCVMNPPFTRSVGGNLLFGNLPEEERQPMQKRLKAIVRKKRIAASITAGLGSVFVALGDEHLREGGTMALVLPRALISGIAWKPTRQLLSEKYRPDYIVVSHEANHWNFSENTALSEVLVVARKIASSTATQATQTTFVNLWRQPRNAIEALSLASSLVTRPPTCMAADIRVRSVQVGHSKVGDAITVSASQLNPDLWGVFCAFAQSELVVSLHELLHGNLYLPGKGHAGELPLCRISDLAEVGFDCRDMHDGFTIAGRKTAYAAFWNHNSARVRQMHQDPNKWLAPLAEPKEGRPLRMADHLWEKASPLLLAERLRMNTMRLSSVCLSHRVLSNVWWTICLKEHLQNETAAQKTLALWLNSSLGILVILGSRVETEGAWMKLKKPIIQRLPVLDVRKIRASQLDQLAQAFDAVAHRDLQSFSEIHEDQTRAAIDGAITQVLRLPDLDIIRALLGREPMLSLRTPILRRE